MAILPPPTGEHIAPPEASSFFKEGYGYVDLLHKYLPFPGTLSDRAVPVPGSQKGDLSAIYRNALSPGGVKDSLFPSVRTLPQLFDNAVKHFGDNSVFTFREHDYVNNTPTENKVSLSYKQVDGLINDYGAGLLYLLEVNPFKNAAKFASHAKIDAHELAYKSYDKDNFSFVLTIYSANRHEWVLTDLVSSAYSITNTALYDTLGALTSEFILELTESPVVALSKNHIVDILDLKAQNPEQLGALVLMISFDPLTPQDSELVARARSENIVLVSMDQVIKTGQVFPKERLLPSPDTLYTISFTSGTTGSKPKGVMLQQRAAISAVSLVLVGSGYEAKSNFCFLPLAHIYERQMTLSGMTYGSTINFPQLNGSPLTLVEDLKFFKPEALSNVPRVYTKFEAALKAATVDSNSSIAKAIFGKAIATKQELQERSDGDKGSHFLYDRLLFPKLKAALGLDNTQFLVTGSAPISVSTIKFLRAALNVGFAQGYGLTESFAGMSLSNKYEAQPGTCGAPCIGCEIKVQQLPEMGYGINDEGGPRGELLLRGPQMFTGYFKNEEETKKTIDDEGWFHTGDVAQIVASTGQIKIIDRVKNFFKLSQGEYVTPEKIENTYMSTDPIISQCFVHGNSTKSFLVGIVGIDVPLATKFLLKQGVAKSSIESPEGLLKEINKPAHKKALLTQINGNIKNKLLGFEKLHNIYLEVEPLTGERNLITPTVKIKRPIAAKFFKEQIDNMYEVEGSLINSSKL
ncbi:acetyl-CoA synthetase-like protein [Suhomyces tanzawaensis NRRL Y-17324]|uniref:Acetyl-CoA synthetase-like protein n=1 Tax=Suhomyces tanzawaensis NRRL Y-17324 TaxID=984487 RepID=A0A1E4SMN3_9ASCO|nr:acetyl-CoA synthetase-like protein [Suhomyces tanzawaensis NRRL Y-17324]ODV80748.1 acetyl-CoA synthetase-like protein [Suhomyces tanzawaensis NRRL Y-17324]